MSDCAARLKATTRRDKLIGTPTAFSNQHFCVRTIRFVHGVGNREVPLLAVLQAVKICSTNRCRTGVVRAHRTLRTQDRVGCVAEQPTCSGERGSQCQSLRANVCPHPPSSGIPQFMALCGALFIRRRPLVSAASGPLAAVRRQLPPACSCCCEQKRSMKNRTDPCAVPEAADGEVQHGRRSIHPKPDSLGLQGYGTPKSWRCMIPVVVLSRHLEVRGVSALTGVPLE